MIKEKVDVTTGFSCNQNCRFCYTKQKDYDKNTKQIKGEIDKICSKENPNEINFTGGEPTIRKDIFELVAYTKEKGIKEIRVTTNGRVFSYEKFTNKIVDSGLTGAIFSIHTSNAELHDYLTQVKGSFEQTIKGLKNLREFSADIDVNVVINTKNYKNLPELVEFLIDGYDIRALCLIFPTIDGNLLKNLWLVPTYNEISDYLHKAIDIIKERKKIAWTLNIPLCFFEGYELYSSVGKLKTKMYWPEQDINLDEKRKEDKVKLKVCNECKYRLVCFGVSRDYLDLKGEEGIKAVKGELVTNIEEIYKI
ncbi:MAG: radical SAM protein [Candidatus Aenigmatarchaeota archaeon]